MILYHGSNIEVTVPDLSMSKPYKDFGKGFYLSGMLSLKEMVEELKYAHGIIYQYYFGSPKALAQLTRL